MSEAPRLINHWQRIRNFLGDFRESDFFRGFCTIDLANREPQFHIMTEEEAWAANAAAQARAWQAVGKDLRNAMLHSIEERR